MRPGYAVYVSHYDPEPSVRLLHFEKLCILVDILKHFRETGRPVILRERIGDEEGDHDSVLYYYLLKAKLLAQLPDPDYVKQSFQLHRHLAEMHSRFPCKNDSFFLKW